MKESNVTEIRDSAADRVRRAAAELNVAIAAAADRGLTVRGALIDMRNHGEPEHFVLNVEVFRRA